MLGGTAIRIEVHYLNYIAEAAGIKEEKVDLPEGASLRDLVRYLGRGHGPQFGSVLLDAENGDPSRFLLILVNQTPTREAETLLKDGDEVVFSGIVSGG